MYVCMYACMCACMYACMYACTYVCMCACMYVFSGMVCIYDKQIDIRCDHIQYIQCKYGQYKYVLCNSPRKVRPARECILCNSILCAYISYVENPMQIYLCSYTHANKFYVIMLDATLDSAIIAVHMFLSTCILREYCPCKHILCKCMRT